MKLPPCPWPCFYPKTFSHMTSNWPRYSKLKLTQRCQIKMAMIPNLSEYETFWYWTYLIWNPSDMEPIWFRTFQLPDWSDTNLTEPFCSRTHLIPDPSALFSPLFCVCFALLLWLLCHDFCIASSSLLSFPFSYFPRHSPDLCCIFYMYTPSVIPVLVFSKCAPIFSSLLCVFW